MSEESLHDILGDIEQSVRDFTGAEAVLAEAEQRRDLTRRAVLEQVERLHAKADAAHAPDLIGVLRHLYWQQPGIHGRPLAEAAGLHLNDMLAAIGPAPSGILCADCGTELLRTSRSWKPPARYGPPLCPDCMSRERDARSRQWRVESLRSRIVAEARVQARASDWRAAAELVLAFPPLSQGVGRGSTADQQDGVWRGWENARVIRNRLITTAADGDDTVGVAVEEAQLLVETALRVADWDTARTRDIVDPITHEPALALLTRLKREVRATAQAARERADAAYPEGYELSEDEESEAWRGTGG
ncbi:hypothetical protein [Streptomyces jumonjinensis]|uniref:Uncharacterized protein n=1 Tax=Streptomyces jumonjinensis TaxID=1945 RepID=A0A646KBU1_STRJU|nr:hypothetical protein [Streptomyces jumonjinensis]MQS99694.1 hypothetical protein [Streptomyces jumonjinensis]